MFNRKGGKVDNLNNARFSHNSIHEVVGRDSTIDGNILDLTDILCHYIAPKLILINMSVYWDKASFSNDNSSTCSLSSIGMMGSILCCGKSGRPPETNSMACWVSCICGSLSGGL